MNTMNTDGNASHEISMVELESLDAPGGWGDFFGGLVGVGVGLGIGAIVLT